MALLIYLGSFNGGRLDRVHLHLTATARLTHDPDPMLTYGSVPPRARRLRMQHECIYNRSRVVYAGTTLRVFSQGVRRMSKNLVTCPDNQWSSSS